MLLGFLFIFLYAPYLLWLSFVQVGYVRINMANYIQSFIALDLLAWITFDTLN